MEDKRQSEVEEAILLKEWDFAKFFPPKSSEVQAKVKERKETEERKAQLQRQSRIEMEDAWAKYKATATPPARHKQLFPQKLAEKSTQDKLTDLLKHKQKQETEASTPNRFFRGFRRENSDLFPLSSTRHSAIYFPKTDNDAAGGKQLRSSGIFNNSRKQIIKPPASGEPILTDFIKMNDSIKMTAQGEIKKNVKKPERKTSNPIDALKNVAAIMRQDSESTGPSRQSSVNSDTPSTSICFSTSASFEKANTPDLTANTLENKTDLPIDPEIVLRPRREKTESDIVFRRNSHYNRVSAGLNSGGERPVLTQDQVTAPTHRTACLL